MDIRYLTPKMAVAPQIAPEDLASLAGDGFVTIIDNRPDIEIPPALHAVEMARAAEAAGLQFIEIPAGSRSMSLDTVAAQKAAIAAAPEGKVLAYCASGTRSTILWALAQAGEMPTDMIVAAAAEAGYDLHHLAPQIDALAGGG